ncbi:MAG: Asp-tRNA(Asn)/Glu-tRNA(Gln) amidotransferase subunit GatA, partial [Ferruginibacter sp.]|nr:Asp-tRNA(Asn)/Glu-tRNA(Gln) amidotransferase subunit GatA [Ferruginibacter sp.]
MFHYSGILPYQQQLRDNTTSCEEATLHYLRQIEEFKHLNAFVSVFTETAIVRSRELDQRRAKGLPMRSLHGVIIALKDVICYEGHPVSAASKMLEGFTPVYHASAVQFLLEEEAILIGSCNCDEFAMGSSNENSFYGPVINGKGQHMVPGGSSGGSAVAVQTGQCMISLGSDTGGSVRQPADFCGVIGFKPGYGMVSRYGLIAYASSFDQIGIFGKYLADVQKVFEVIAQPDPRDTTMNQEKKSGSPITTSPRFGYF